MQQVTDVAPEVLSLADPAAGFASIASIMGLQERSLQCCQLPRHILNDPLEMPAGKAKGITMKQRHGQT